MDWLKVGFTGSREGITSHQYAALKRALGRLPVGVALHGDCVGADDIFHALVLTKCKQVNIEIHPPNDDSFRAFRKAWSTKRPLPYLERNQNIVDEADLLLACVKTDYEQTRSGTWSTVRKGIRKGIPVVVFRPNGSANIHNDPEFEIHRLLGYI